MASSTSPANHDRLPSSLFTVYQAYKRGTSVVLDWLTAFDKVPPKKPDTTDDALAPSTLTAKQLLEKARTASERKRIPPPTVHDAFRIVLVNRNKLTRYYEDLPAASEETTAATTRHKFFNGTLAQAYTILFPPETPKRKSKKTIKHASQPQVTSSVNTFAVLSDFVHQEPGFDACASDFWQAETSVAPIESTIADDSVGDAMALHAYVLELQSITETIRGVWNAAATGEISLAAAGWLTNVVQYYIQEWDPVGFKELSEQDNFLEITHGYGLIWPFNDLHGFRALVKDRGPSLTVVERRKFEDYFIPQSELRTLRQEFVDSTLDYLPTNGVDTVQEHDQELLDISEKRYIQEQRLVKSMCRSLRQHPFWDSCNSGGFWDAWDESNLQSPYGVPVLQQLKFDQEGLRMRLTLVLGVWIFVESCRSFTPQTPSEGLRRTNNKIKVLSFAAEVRLAIEKMLGSVNEETKYGSLSELWVNCTAVTIVQLRKFTSEKVFDLYSQSPWVTGSYMAMIASRSMYIGLEVLNEHGFFTSPLHLYNMLQQLGVLCAGIPILERLCDTLRTVVFPYLEGRPTRDFDKMARVANNMFLYRGDKFFKEARARTTPTSFGENSRINA